MPTQPDGSISKRISSISDMLRKCAAVTRHDSSGHSEADAIAHAVLDMESTFVFLKNEVFPKLSSGALSGDDAVEVLWEIRDQLRHIVYHIRDCKSFEDVLTE